MRARPFLTRPAHRRRHQGDAEDFAVEAADLPAVGTGDHLYL
jgi:hypothetical protein